MAKIGYSKTIVCGLVDDHPRIRDNPNGGSIASLMLVTCETWEDKKTGTVREFQEKHRVVAFNRFADIIKAYVVKGQMILVDGKTKTRKWEDRYITEIVVSINGDIQIIDWGTKSKSKPVRERHADITKTEATKQSSLPKFGDGNANDDSYPFDDDIPF